MALRLTILGKTTDLLSLQKFITPPGMIVLVYKLGYWFWKKLLPWSLRNCHPSFPSGLLAHRRYDVAENWSPRSLNKLPLLPYKLGGIILVGAGINPVFKFSPPASENAASCNAPYLRRTTSQPNASKVFCAFSHSDHPPNISQVIS